MADYVRRGKPDYKLYLNEGLKLFVIENLTRLLATEIIDCFWRESLFTENIKELFLTRVFD